MPDLQRVRVTWQGGGVVGPSVSTFHFLDTATGFKADLVAFYTAMVARFPSVVNFTVPGNGDVIDSASGALVGGWSDGADVGVAGTGSAQFAMGTGARVVWLTNGFINGRRVRGSTFLVPLDASSYSTDGSLSAGISTIEGAAAALVTAQAGEFVVYHRAVAGAGGGYSSITASTVPDKISTLRSRRT